MSENRAKKVRQPLKLLSKWQVMQYWVQRKPRLPHSSLAVLARLLDRQNPNTGRCDPSIAGIAEELGFAERTIYLAIDELEALGALKGSKQKKRSTNQYLIYSVEEILQRCAQARNASETGSETDLQMRSDHSEATCSETMKRVAPETVKETQKKLACEHESSSTSTKKQKPIAPEIGQGEFESRIAKVFEKQGYGYVGLLELSDTCIEKVYLRFVHGEITFPKAVGLLLDQYRALGA